MKSFSKLMSRAGGRWFPSVSSSVCYFVNDPFFVFQAEEVSRRLDMCRVELEGQRDPIKIRVSEANHKPWQSRGGGIQVTADTLPSCWFSDSGSK